MTHCSLLKSPASLIALCLTVLFPVLGQSAPVPSQPTVTPGALSLDLSSNIFATLNGRLYLSNLRSSTFPVSQTYPESTDDSSYASTPVNLRLSPSIVMLSEGWLRLVRLDVEYSIHNNIQGASDSREQSRPDPLKRPTGYDQMLTEAYLSVLGAHVGVEVGRVRPVFGLGIAANPGTFELGASNVNEWAHSPQYGDIVDRVRTIYTTQGFGVKSNGVTLSAGVERVVQDDRIDSDKGDSGEGVFAGAQLNYADQVLALGLVRRVVKYGEGGESNVWNLAGSFNAHAKLSKRYTLTLSGEVNVLRGTSTLPDSIFIDGLFDVNAQGAVLRTQVTRGLHQLQLEGGFASGDSDRYDDNQSTFQFDPNYRVGLALFPMVNATYARIAIENASDPNYRARLPRGAERTLTSGSIENAIYINPTWTHSLNNATRLSIGYVQAWRATPYFDLFRSNLNGGVATDPLGQLDNRNLGREFNVGLAHAITTKNILLHAYLVGAMAWSSVNLPDDETPVYASSARLEASW
jgi:hypothetical protein